MYGEVGSIWDPISKLFDFLSSEYKNPLYYFPT